MTVDVVEQQASGIPYCSNEESSLRIMEVAVAEPLTKKPGERDY